MKINDLFSNLLPEEQPLSPESKSRILSTVMESGKKHRTVRPVRMTLIAAVMVVVLCVSAVAAYRIDWNKSYREFFNIKSEDVQGFVEYPETEVTEKPTIQPVSCVTGIKIITFRFAYGPISAEQAEKFEWRDGSMEQFLDVSIPELPKYTPDAGFVKYDEETGMALFESGVWYDEFPETLTLDVVKRDVQTGEIIEELGTITMKPQSAEPKTANLNITVIGPDGEEGKVLCLNVNAGSYWWVEEMPKYDSWSEPFGEPVVERDQYVTEWSNTFLMKCYNDAYLNYSDGTSRSLGSGDPMWDGEHYCEWGGGVYDVDNLVSVTINGVEYPFE